MTIKNVLKNAEQRFAYGLEMAKEQPENSDYTNGYAMAVCHMAKDAIDLTVHTTIDERSEAYDVLDEMYDRTRREISRLYRKAVNSDD